MGNNYGDCVPKLVKERPVLQSEIDEKNNTGGAGCALAVISAGARYSAADTLS